MVDDTTDTLMSAEQRQKMYDIWWAHPMPHSVHQPNTVEKGNIRLHERSVRVALALLQRWADTAEDDPASTSALLAQKSE